LQHGAIEAKKVGFNNIGKPQVIEGHDVVYGDIKKLTDGSHVHNQQI
jgi:hypothetical protein